MMKFWGKGREVSEDSSSEDSMSQSSSPSQPASPSTPSSSAAIFSGTGPARPIRLVYYDEKGKFSMDPEAVATLQLVKGPIGVVSVCGRARQGKSFILNQLLGRSSGFQVASTHKPCTKGLWLWSAPLKKTALDGTEYNLLLLDSEGIDAYDQTGTYSTQIFSLAVLLSSMFIYNQMGGIDEAALDRLSLVTEMTKHIRVRASGGKTTASELGQFSPIFVWLLRDFYLDLVEDNRRITPRDYLELALRPVQGGGGRDIAPKNEIRDSIRALFPDRECFTLVRPLNKENDLQRLDQISLDKMRPEFKAGLDALTKFVFERTRPKQLGATVMTGPILVGITESYISALNNGAVPTISSSWQSVEEAECRRAFDSATEVYMSTFDRSKPPEEVALREAHEKAVQRSLSAFNASAVGTGSVRQKHEKLLQNFFKKAFEEYKRNAYNEADARCSNAIQNMERKLRAACNAFDAKMDNVVNVLDNLLSEYEASFHGPGKWQKLSMFLQQSLEGPIRDLAKKLINEAGLEKSSLLLKCRSMEDKLVLLNKQLEASEKHKSDYLKRYKDATDDKEKIADVYMSRISNLQSKSSALEEKNSTLLKTLDSAKQESMEWRRKWEHALSKQQAADDQASSEIAFLKSRTSAAEASLAAAREQVQSAQEEAGEWKRKYDIAVKEVKAALENAAAAQEQSKEKTQQREDALRKEFAHTLIDKEKEIRERAAKIDHAEQCVTTLNIELKAAESKIKSYDVEISSLKYEIKELGEKLEAANDKAQSFERKARMVEQDKNHLEHKYQSEFNRFEEVQERCKIAEKEAKRATEVADQARAEAVTAQREKGEIQRLAMERLARIERCERHIENLERQTNDLTDDVERSRVSEIDALSKVEMLEARVEEREREIESLLKSNNEQRASTVQVLEKLLETERAARSEANNRAQALSVQLQVSQTKLDTLQQELTSVRLNETALDSKLKTASLGKRSRVGDYDMGMESVHDVNGNDGVIRGNKRSRSTSSPFKQAQTDDGGSMMRIDEDNQSQDTNTEDYTKFTALKLRQELTGHNVGMELLQLGSKPLKKELLALYEKHVLSRS